LGSGSSFSPASSYWIRYSISWISS